MDATAGKLKKIHLLALGDSMVGKTSILKTFQGEYNSFQHYSPTIGVDLATKVVKLNAKLAINVNMWDTAGLERFQSITRAIYQKCEGVLLVFNVCDRKSYSHTVHWMDLAKKNCIQDLSMCLVGNKTDLQQEREVSKKDAETLASELEIPYFETSAKTGSNVKEMFGSLIRSVVFGRDTERITCIGPSLVLQDGGEIAKSRCCSHS